MGCASSCFGAPDVDHFSGSNNGCCAQFCLLAHTLANKYQAVFIRGGMQPVYSSDHGQVSSQPTSALRNSAGSTTAHREPSTSNTSLRYTQLQPDVATRYKTVSTHSRVDPEPQSESNIQVTQEMLNEGGSKECYSEFHLEDLSVNEDSAVGYVYYSSEEDDDECPICLEEYTPENPMIITQCSHGYHLGCLFEWEKRSKSCPVCERPLHWNLLTTRGGWPCGLCILCFWLMVFEEMI